MYRLYIYFAMRRIAAYSVQENAFQTQIIIYN